MQAVFLHCTQNIYGCLAKHIFLAIKAFNGVPQGPDGVCVFMLEQTAWNSSQPAVGSTQPKNVPSRKQSSPSAPAHNMNSWLSNTATELSMTYSLRPRQSTHKLSLRSTLLSHTSYKHNRALRLKLKPLLPPYSR